MKRLAGATALSLVVSPLLAVGVLADDTEFATRFKEAQEFVHTDAGRKYFDGVLTQAFEKQFGERVKRLGRCQGNSKDGVNFVLLMQLDVDGRVQAAQASPVSRIASCYLKDVTKDRFAKPPVAGVWVAARIRFGKQDAVEVSLPLPGKSTTLLIESLSSEDAGVRSAAALELAGAKERQAEAIAALRPLCADPDRSVRYAAIWALSHLKFLGGAPAYDSPPKPTRYPRPSYPQPAFYGKIEGTVMVEILVGEEGEIARAAIRQSIPDLDTAALECVRQWSFTPALVNEVPTATLALVPVTFRIY